MSAKSNKPRRCVDCGRLIVGDLVSKWTSYWCLPCDERRRERISAKLDDIMRKTTKG